MEVSTVSITLISLLTKQASIYILYIRLICQRFYHVERNNSLA